MTRLQRPCACDWCPRLVSSARFDFCVEHWHSLCELRGTRSPLNPPAKDAIARAQKIADAVKTLAVAAGQATSPDDP